MVNDVRLKSTKQASFSPCWYYSLSPYIRLTLREWLLVIFPFKKTESSVCM